MTTQTIVATSNTLSLERYTGIARRRAQIEHRTMNVWEHQGREDRAATLMMQVMNAEMEDPPPGWVLVAVVHEPDPNPNLIK